MVQRVKRRERRLQQEAREREDMVRTARYYASIGLKVDKLDAQLECVAKCVAAAELGRVFAPGEMERMIRAAGELADKTNEEVEEEVQRRVDCILKDDK